MHGRFRRRLSAFGDVFGYSAAACGELWLKPRACRFCVFGVVSAPLLQLWRASAQALRPPVLRFWHCFRLLCLQLLVSFCSSLAPVGSAAARGELLVRPRACRFSGFGCFFGSSAAAPRELLLRPRACQLSGFGSVFGSSGAAPGELLVRPRACRFPGFGIHAYIHTYIERQIRPYTHSHIIRIHITSTIHTYRRAFAQACASAWVGCLFFYRLRMDARRPMSAGSLVKFGNSSYSNQATVVKNAFGNLKTKANPRGA